MYKISRTEFKFYILSLFGAYFFIACIGAALFIVISSFYAFPFISLLAGLAFAFGACTIPAIRILRSHISVARMMKVITTH